MITFLSHRLRHLMIFLLAVVGISFIFFGNWTPSGVGNADIGKIDGKNISLSTFQSAQIGLSLVVYLETGFTPQSQLLNRETWSRLLILNAANRAGIQVSDDEVFAFIRRAPVFQREGKFDPSLFDTFQQQHLTPRYISVDRLKEMVRDQLKVQAMIGAVARTSFVQPSAVTNVINQYYGPANVSVIRFDTGKTRAEIKPTKEDLTAFYEKSKEGYLIPEKRRVQFVAFKLSPQDQKLTGTARQDALQALGQKAFEFTQAIAPVAATTPVPFEDAAKTANVPVTTSAFVAASDVLLEDPRITEAAFKLSPNLQFSDVLEVPDGYYVLKLGEVQAAQKAPFAQVEAQVRQDYIHSVALQKIDAEAVKARKEISDKIAAGETWANAVKAAGLTATDVPTFVPGEKDSTKVANSDIIRASAIELEPGHFSEPLAAGDGLILVYLRDRKPASEEMRGKIATSVHAQLEDRARNRVVDEWFRSLATQDGTQSPQLGPVDEESGS